MARRANYGIDAPGQVRNLALFATLALAVSLAGRWFGSALGDWADVAVSAGQSMALVLYIVVLVMLWSSKAGKFRVRDSLVRRLDLKGNERVLDVGCGRGLALIGAAKKLSSGQAVGIDLWQAEDLSGNNAAATLANASIEGVADRVTVETGDMRALPFADASFDAVISMTAIHNVPDAEGRDKALAEIVRVLKPGGRLAIYDIFHPQRYLKVLKTLGMADVKGSVPIFLWFVFGRSITARKP